jgi:hypothetical protein
MLFRTAPVLAAALLSTALQDAAAAEQLTAKPFAKLFTPPAIGAQTRQRPSPLPLPRPGAQPPLASSDQPPTGQPRIACGTRVVPVNPAFDARMRRQAPARPKPSARIVPTPPCD